MGVGLLGDVWGSAYGGGGSRDGPGSLPKD